MNANPRIASYLDAVTSSLDGDDELRLDVRAELAAHLDEAAAQFQSEGRSPDESAELAIKSLGPATDYAGDLIAANRPRMRPRARVRLLLRALVIPAAILAALVSLRVFELAANIQTLSAAFPNSISYGGRVTQWLLWPVLPDRGLSREQRLILHGDPARADITAKQRAIWEAWPTNLVYLNNYLTVLFASYDTLGHTPAERFAALDRELDRAIVLDPQNARYRYMRAAKRLAQGAKVEAIDLGKNERGGSRSDYRLTVQDRAILDRAMAEFLAGTRKPVLRRYTADMLRERLTIMDTPQSLVEQIAQLSVAAGTLLPDLSEYRNLARASIAYAKLLIEEGHPEAARPFIDAWQPLSVQVANDSFTLLDVLVAAAVARIGQTNAVALYRELGDTANAARTLQAATALYAPVAAFKARIKAQQKTGEDHMPFRYMGIMSSMFLPSLGESVTAEELKPGRMVEYVVLDQATCGVTNLLLLVAMIAALLVALRWRFVRGGAGAPLLLLPTARQIARILGYGVILPICV